MRVPGQPRGTPSSRSHGDVGLREVKRLVEGHAAGGGAESHPSRSRTHRSGRGQWAGSRVTKTQVNTPLLQTPRPGGGRHRDHGRGRRPSLSSRLPSGSQTLGPPKRIEDKGLGRQQATCGRCTDSFSLLFCLTKEKKKTWSPPST